MVVSSDTVMTECNKELHCEWQLSAAMGKWQERAAAMSREINRDTTGLAERIVTHKLEIRQRQHWACRRKRDSLHTQS